MSLRDGALPSKQSPVTRGDCFATCARNDMQTASLREWWLSSPECSSLAPPARAGVRGVSKPQSATGEGLSVLLPSANRLREVLAKALPERIKLQRALNRILRAQTPRFVKKGKRSDYIALDLTLVPYHGECYEDEKEIVRSQAKSGTTPSFVYCWLVWHS